ncbi:YeiH family protein [Paraburkholderia kururiensis]|uniref:Sulfate exporter family transporter n=1 Tax=Paraburkholderia kururiensis TaxID=984307 RepID=A0ABZ0WFT9_9BURK|nr:putative sulfate exporter family transporter [Paraburkholderia kururiensis]WQD76208.1 putative sulfate exporter family transporter [Paraburkholderia kururiensis]
MSDQHHTLPSGAQPRDAGSKNAAAAGTATQRGGGLFSTEDWWAVWVGFVVIVAAYALFASGGSIKWLAVAPAKWSSIGQAVHDLAAHALNYIALFAVFAVLFGASVVALKQRLAHFLPSFLILFVGSVLIFTLGAWVSAAKYNLEPPLVALALGLIVSNVFTLPQWFSAGLRVEFYIKVGIVLLGATLPFTLLVWAGPVAVAQASIVSLVTFFVIFFVATRLGLERRFAAVLGVGGAVCGVSAAIAIAGAVRAKREQASVAITLVIAWAIVMIFVLPFVSRSLGLSTALAGAWIGTSEFADAAGIAAAQAYGDFAKHAGGAIAGAPEASLQAFTLMKVVGRDIWIGIWAFVLAIVATTRWDARDAGAVQAKADAGEIWARFPKFVIGFVVASALVTWIASHYSLADYRKVVTPEFVAPITALRTWAFIFCFLSIGLTTRLRVLTATGLKPFLAFTAGVAVNIAIGYALSAHVFAPYWHSLEQGT